MVWIMLTDLKFFFSNPKNTNLIDLNVLQSDFHGILAKTNVI